MLSYLRRWYVVTLVLLGSLILAFMLWPTEQVPPTEAVAEPEPEPEPVGFQTGEVSFTVDVRDVVNPYEVLGIFVMPGEEVELEASFTGAVGSVTVEAAGSEPEQIEPDEWRWQAPREPGLYPIHVTDTRADGETMTINAFVKEPYDHDGMMDGYRIGSYPTVPLRGDTMYVRPDGFIVLGTSETMESTQRERLSKRRSRNSGMVKTPAR